MKKKKKGKNKKIIDCGVQLPLAGSQECDLRGHVHGGEFFINPENLKNIKVSDLVLKSRLDIAVAYEEYEKAQELHDELLKRGINHKPKPIKTLSGTIFFE